MRILVAGGAGYIGSVVVPALLARGHHVEVVDRLWFGNHLPASVPVQQRDIMSLTEQDLKGFDRVIFLAGISNDPMADYSPAQNFVENGAAAAYLAYTAKRAGVPRYIYGGSCSVYGYKVDELSDETCAANSVYAYGISKLQGEFASLQLHDDAFSVICFRQGTVSGHSPRMRLDLIVNTMFMTAMTSQTIVVNNPDVRRPLLGIDDAAAAYVLAAEAGLEVWGVFNIASGNYTVGQVAESVRATVKRKLDVDVRIETHHRADLRNYAVSTDKAVRTLRFKPVQTVESIVEQLIERREQILPFDQDRYFNIRTFKALYPEPPGA